MVSVVIPTKNRNDLLQDCLASVLKQKFSGAYEIIVVDDGSNKPVVSAVDRVHVVRHETSRGKSEARNSGVRASRGEIVAFVDDDMTVDKSWLHELTRMFSTSTVVGVYGETRYVGDGKKHYFPERVVANPRARFPMGGNIAYRREVFNRIGFFDSQFDAFANEDTEFALRALRVGTLRPNRKAIATHSQSVWTAKTLIKSAKNASVWPVLMKRYSPQLRAADFRTPILGRIVFPADYFLIIFSPIIIPLLLLRFFAHGQRNVVLFFLKWPILLLLRRVFIWREALREKIFVL
jgi:glycosyltransferase involved in cell wall biosynthesis